MANIQKHPKIMVTFKCIATTPRFDRKHFISFSILLVFITGVKNSYVLYAVCCSIALCVKIHYMCSKVFVYKLSTKPMCIKVKLPSFFVVIPPKKKTRRRRNFILQAQCSFSIPPHYPYLFSPNSLVARLNNFVL